MRAGDTQVERHFAGWNKWNAYIGFNEVRFGARAKHFDAARGRYVADLTATDRENNASPMHYMQDLADKIGGVLRFVGNSHAEITKPGENPDGSGTIVVPAIWRMTLTKFPAVRSRA